MELNRRFTVGAKRNYGCERAAGEYVAHWDDDDYSAPGRLADQLSRISESGWAVTGYRSMRFTDGAQWWLYSGSSSYALGTSLFYRRDWWQRHRFPSIDVAEDGAFVDVAAAAKQLITADAGDLMYATNHKGNTSPRQMQGKNWTKL